MNLNLQHLEKIRANQYQKMILKELLMFWINMAQPPHNNATGQELLFIFRDVFYGRIHRW